MLRHITLAIAAIMMAGASANAVPVVLQEATATFQQGNFGNVDQTIDGNVATGGIGFFNARQNGTVIAYETATDLIGPGAFTFTITQAQFNGHAPQSFRISVTDADRSTFADGGPTNGFESPAGDVQTGPGNWTLINPSSFSSAGGATGTTNLNGIINVSGANPQTDTFTITGINPLDTVTGIRLEVLPGADGFVGRGIGAPHFENGNAVITEFAADFTTAQGTTYNRKELNIANATATFDQGGNFTIGSAVDGVLNGDNGWGIAGQGFQEQSAVFALDTPINLDDLVIEIAQLSRFAQHKLQEFRISATTDANPTAGDAGINWMELTPDLVETSLAGSSGTINLLDNSVLISGDANVPDLYSILFDGRLDGITGIRLEALLENGRVGFTAGNGNIVLTEFRVFATPHIPEPASALLLGLAGIATLRRRRA